MSRVIRVAMDEGDGCVWCGAEPEEGYEACADCRTALARDRALDSELAREREIEALTDRWSGQA